MRCMCVSASSHRHTLRIMCAKWDISARSCVFVCLSSAQSLHTLFIFSISLILGPLHIFRSSSFALLESVFVSSFFFLPNFSFRVDIVEQANWKMPAAIAEIKIYRALSFVWNAFTLAQRASEWALQGCSARCSWALVDCRRNYHHGSIYMLCGSIAEQSQQRVEYCVEGGKKYIEMLFRYL